MQIIKLLVTYSHGKNFKKTSQRIYNEEIRDLSLIDLELYIIKTENLKEIKIGIYKTLFIEENKDISHLNCEINY